MNGKYPHLKIEIITESTKKQLQMLEILRHTGEMSHSEANLCQQIVMDVLALQKKEFCA